MTPAGLLDLLIDRADKLRTAGVLRVEMAGIKFELMPKHPALSQPRQQTEDEDSDADPLNDPRTYGRADSVPGFSRLRDRGEPD